MSFPEERVSAQPVDLIILAKSMNLFPYTKDPVSAADIM